MNDKEFINYFEGDQIDILKSVKNQYDNTSEMYQDPKIVNLNYDENKGFEFGLGTTDKSEDLKRTKHIIGYMEQAFEHSKTSEYLNENQKRLWFWENVSFIFSIGRIFRDEDREIFDALMNYFNKTNQTFLPNVYKVYDFNDDLIKEFEKIHYIGNGNYHILLIPFVHTKDEKILFNAPESAYKRFGVVEALVNIEDIVNFMCDVMYKYGAIKHLLTDTVSNILNIESVQRVPTKQQTIRVMNPSQSNPMINDPMRMDRLGYFDYNAKDTYELINPEQDITLTAPHSYYLRPSDLNDGVKSDIYYRRPAKTVQRETLTNTGENVKRYEGKKGLWKQIHSDQEVYNTYVDTTPKGAILKVNTMYESTAEREDKPNYQIYENEGLYHFIDDVPKREFIPILRISKDIEPDSKRVYEMPAEQQGIFAK